MKHRNWPLWQATFVLKPGWPFSHPEQPGRYAASMRAPDEATARERLDYIDGVPNFIMTTILQVDDGSADEAPFTLGKKENDAWSQMKTKTADR